MTVFGQIITGQDVADAVTDTLRTWFPSYLAEVGAQHGRDRAALPPPRSYNVKHAFTKFPEDQLPAVLVVVPGTLDTPERHGTSIDVSWSVGVGVVVSGMDEESTNSLLVLYAAAIRTIMIQKSSLGDFATETWWLSETYDEIPAAQGDSRSLAAASVGFGVNVPEVVARFGGPQTPPGDPHVAPSDWPTVATVHTGVGVED